MSSPRGVDGEYNARLVVVAPACIYNPATARRQEQTHTHTNTYTSVYIECCPLIGRGGGNEAWHGRRLPAAKIRPPRQICVRGCTCVALDDDDARILQIAASERADVPREIRSGLAWLFGRPMIKSARGLLFSVGRSVSVISIDPQRW